MNTMYFRTRFLIYAVLLSILITSCSQPDTRATMESIRGKAEAAALLAGSTLQNSAAEVWAIDKWAEAANGAFMLFSEESQLAVFITQGGTNAEGVPYFFLGTIDTAHTALVDTDLVLSQLGIDANGLTLNKLSTLLRARGFREMTPAAVPTLAATVRLALAFLRSMGNTVVEFLAVPAGIMTPEMLNPACLDNPEWCKQIDG